MSGVAETVAAIRAAAGWDERVSLVRRIPERFGVAQHAEVYAAVAADVYAADLAPDFAFVHWTDDYELAPFERAYAEAAAATDGFTRVAVAQIDAVLFGTPATLRVFRTILGLTRPEFAAGRRRRRARAVDAGAHRVARALDGVRTPSARRRVARRGRDDRPRHDRPSLRRAGAAAPRQDRQARHRGRLGDGAPLRRARSAVRDVPPPAPLRRRLPSGARRDEHEARRRARGRRQGRARPPRHRVRAHGRVEPGRDRPPLRTHRAPRARLRRPRRPRRAARDDRVQVDERRRHRARQGGALPVAA